MYFQSLVSLKYLNISLFVNLPPQTPGQPSQFSIWIFLFLPNQRVIYLDPSPSHYKYYHKHQNTQNPWNQTHLSPCLGFLNPHVIWRRWIFSRVYLKFSLKSIHFILLPQLPIFIKMKKKKEKTNKKPQFIFILFIRIVIFCMQPQALALLLSLWFWIAPANFREISFTKLALRVIEAEDICNPSATVLAVLSVLK